MDTCVTLERRLIRMGSEVRILERMAAPRPSSLRKKIRTVK